MPRRDHLSRDIHVMYERAQSTLGMHEMYTRAQYCYRPYLYSEFTCSTTCLYLLTVISDYNKSIFFPTESGIYNSCVHIKSALHY